MMAVPDRVSLDLVMELVEMQVGPDPGYDLIALAMGVSTASLTRFKRDGTVPRARAEWLYDRLARGIGAHKSKLDPWEWPLDYDERAQIASAAQYKSLKARRAS